MKNKKVKKLTKSNLPVCCYCHRVYDITKDNYGWHYRDGVFERCLFPLQATTKLNTNIISKKMGRRTSKYKNIGAGIMWFFDNT